MMKFVGYAFSGVLGLVFASMACGGGGQLDISDAWIKQLPPIIAVRAGYVRISNPTDRAMKLVGVDSVDFERADMHETMMADGTMKMVKAGAFAIPSRGELLLQPGGKHLMLFVPTHPLAVGDEAVINLEFDDGSVRAVPFRVKP